MSYNKTISMGRLTRDPKLEKTASDKDFCNFDIALDDGFGSNKKTTYIQITTWGKQAQFVSKHFSKGSGIHIEGRLTQDRWKDKETGNMRYRIRITAERIQFPVGSKKKDYNNDNEEDAGIQGNSPGWPNQYEAPDEIPL